MTRRGLPIRRTIAPRYEFEDVRFKVIDWGMQARGRALREEFMLARDLYFYCTRRSWRTQDWIDLTEPLRHPLGLQFANRVRLARGLREWRKASK